MLTPEQKKKLLKAKIAVALHDELGRVPKKEEIENVFLLARVMYKAVLGLHYQRQQQKKTDNWPFFNIRMFDFFQFSCYYTVVMKYLESRKERVGGELTIKGTRIRVAQAITLLANGYTIEQLHEWWPHVPVSVIRGAVEEATQYISNSANA